MANPRIPYRMSNERPRLEPLAGRPIMVHVVVNVEHWVFEQAMPRTIVTPPHGRETVPDVPNFSWADYGMRCGLPRIIELLEERGLPASTSCNAGVIDAYPSAAAAMRDAGWEYIGHGMHQRTLNQTEGGESDVINATLDKIAGFTGTRPRGWLSPGLRETLDTPEQLRGAGVDHVYDWVVDDLPSWMSTARGPLLSMPYNVEINDSIIYAIERHATGEMLGRLKHTLALFERETHRNPRVLAIGLHPHLIAVPHRMHELEAMVDALQASSQTIFVTGSQIADWYSVCEPYEKSEVAST
ncbi:MAG: polysaccharide deacetylase family protein [Hyphomicrobiaceae bacterium]